MISIANTKYSRNGKNLTFTSDVLFENIAVGTVTKTEIGNMVAKINSMFTSVLEYNTLCVCEICEGGSLDDSCDRCNGVGFYTNSFQEQVFALVCELEKKDTEKKIIEKYVSRGAKVVVKYRKKDAIQYAGWETDNRDYIIEWYKRQKKTIAFCYP